MSEFQQYETVVRGGGGRWVVELIDAGGWPVGSDAWDWDMLVAPESNPDHNSHTLNAAAAVIDTLYDPNDRMTLDYAMTAPESLECGTVRHRVDIKSDDAGVVGVRYYWQASGALQVRDPYGGG